MGNGPLWSILNHRVFFSKNARHGLNDDQKKRDKGAIWFLLKYYGIINAKYLTS